MSVHSRVKVSKFIRECQYIYVCVRKLIRECQCFKRECQ